MSCSPGSVGPPTRAAPAPTSELTLEPFHQPDQRLPAKTAKTGRDTREQADLPAEQPSSPQGARFPSAHAHPCRSCGHLLAPPQGPQEPRGLSEPRPIPERLSHVLAVDHRLRDSNAFRRTVRFGRRAGGAALVTHLLPGETATGPEDAA